MKRILAQAGSLLFLCLSVTGALAAERMEISFSYPSFKGDFYASGLVAFPPGAVGDENRLKVVNAAGLEVATNVKVRETWFDGSLLSADITFAANSSRPDRYQLVYGGETVRAKRLGETAVLPVSSFSVGGAARTVETMDMPVGQINVRVDRSPDIRYYWHLMPLTLLLFLTVLRSRRTGR